VIGRWLSRGAEGLAKPIGSAYETRQREKGQTRRTEVVADASTEQSRHLLTAVLNGAAGLWRPIWMVTLITCVAAYVWASIRFYGQWMDAMQAGEKWVSGDEMAEWKSGWIALGGVLFSLGTVSFLGYSPFRSGEKIVAKLKGTGDLPQAPRSPTPIRTVTTDPDDGLKPEPVPDGVPMHEPPFVRADR